MCLSSCHHEVLETAATKGERRDHVLQMRKGTTFDVGDKVWLSLSTQKLHVSHKHAEPLDEGSFDIVERIGYETYKVLLGDGVCATFPSYNLVPCFADQT